MTTLSKRNIYFWSRETLGKVGIYIWRQNLDLFLAERADSLEKAWGKKWEAILWELPVFFFFLLLLFLVGLFVLLLTAGLQDCIFWLHHFSWKAFFLWAAHIKITHKYKAVLGQDGTFIWWLIYVKSNCYKYQFVWFTEYRISLKSFLI